MCVYIILCACYSTTAIQLNNILHWHFIIKTRNYDHSVINGMYSVNEYQLQEYFWSYVHFSELRSDKNSYMIIHVIYIVIRVFINNLMYKHNYFKIFNSLRFLIFYLVIIINLLIYSLTSYLYILCQLKFFLITLCNSFNGSHRPCPFINSVLVQSDVYCSPNTHSVRSAFKFTCTVLNTRCVAHCTLSKPKKTL